MESSLQTAIPVLWFLLGPAILLAMLLLAAAVRRLLRGGAPARKTSPAGRYGPALEQQELDQLLDEMDSPQPRRGFSPFSFRH